MQYISLDSNTSINTLRSTLSNKSHVAMTKILILIEGFMEKF